MFLSLAAYTRIRDIVHESLIERFSIQMSHEMITAAFTHAHAYADILHAKKKDLLLYTKDVYFYWVFQWL